MKKFERTGKINIVDDFNVYLGIVIDKSVSFFVSHKSCLNNTPFESFSMVKTTEPIDKAIYDESYFDPKFKIEMNIKDGEKKYSIVVFRIKTPERSDKYIHVCNNSDFDNWYEFEALEVKCKK